MLLTQHDPAGLARSTLEGAAVNNDGNTKGVFQHPCRKAQTSLVVDALRKANCDPTYIAMVECHGTGTRLGDPIEVEALSTAFRTCGLKVLGRCAIGSVKSNIGHTGAASGIMGLAKACMSMAEKKIPKTLHCQHLNPNIDFSSSPFIVAQAARPLEGNPEELRAGVSSFGLGGTNAHVVIKRAAISPATKPRPLTRFKRSVFRHPNANQDMIQPGHGYPATSSHHPVLGNMLWLNGSKLHKCRLSRDDSRVSFVWDHAVHGAAVLPAAAYVELFLEIGQRQGLEHVCLQDVAFEHPLKLGESECSFLLRIADQKDGFMVQATAIDEAIVYARATVKDAAADSISLGHENGQQVDVSAIYMNASYGPSFQTVLNLEVGSRTAFARLGNPNGQAFRSDFHVDPAMLDGAVQVMLSKLQLSSRLDGEIWPQGIKSVFLHCTASQPLDTASVNAVWDGDDGLRASCKIFSGGEPILELQGLTFAKHKEVQSDGLVLQLLWEQKALLAAASGSSFGRDANALAFVRQNEPSSQLLAEMQKAMPETGITTVYPGQGEASIVPQDEKAYELQLEKLSSQQPMFVMYLWGLDCDVHPDARLAESCLGFIFLVKALVKQKRPVKRLLVVTAGAAKVTTPDHVTPSQSTFVGLCRAVQMECPELGLLHVDVSTKMFEQGDMSNMARALLDEAQGQGQSELGVSLREARYAWRPALMQLPSLVSHEKIGVFGGSYLITGGLGGLGQEIAAWLCEHGVSKLVLTGRSLKPLIQKMSNKQADISICMGDVSQKMHVKSIFQSHGQTLTGIVHAAGVLRDGRIVDVIQAHFDDVMKPKVLAAHLLHVESDRLQLKDFVLMSSTSATMGSFGQVLYAGANSYLDGLAGFRHDKGLCALSLNWGPWAEVGMAAELPPPAGVHQLKVQTACDILGQART